MKKSLTLFFVIILLAFIDKNETFAQGSELKFSRVIDTALTFTIPCSVNLVNGYYVEILTLSNDANTVTKINSIFIDWPLIAISMGSSSCGSGGSGQFRLQPALVKNGIYTEITTSGSSAFNGVYWASKGTKIAVKASTTSASYSYLASAFNGKIRISAIEFKIMP
jgi:hypothetical protein